MCDSRPMGDNPLLSKLHSAGTGLPWSHCPQPVESSNRDEETETQRGEVPALLTKAGYFRFLGNTVWEHPFCPLLAAHKEAQFV